jgi:TQXA domain-containing protein
MRSALLHPARPASVRLLAAVAVLLGLLTWSPPAAYAVDGTFTGYLTAGELTTNDGTFHAGLMGMSLADGTSLEVYCVDYYTDVIEGPGYESVAWSASGVTNLANVKAVLLKGYPSVSVAALAAAAGVDPATLSVDAAAAATKAAIWSYTNGIIMVIRHGEKPTTSTETGFEPDGTPNRDALTIRGWQRAGALAALFDPVDRPLPAGLRRPERIVAARTEDDGRHLRERQTVAPLADKLGLPVQSDHSVPEVAAAGAAIAPLTGATLVCWEHKLLPRIVEGLGPVSPTPPTVWPDDRFDLVWVFTRSGAGWIFSQVPQLLLEGDRPTPTG